MPCYCKDKKLKCCSGCLTDDEQDQMYVDVMNIPVKDRIREGCDCYMCNDKDSCRCIDLSLWNQIGGKYKQDLINKEINKIKKEIEEDK